MKFNVNDRIININQEHKSSEEEGLNLTLD